MKKILLALFFSIQIMAVAQTQFAWVQRAGLPADARHRTSCAVIGNRCYIGLGHVNAVLNVLYHDWWEYDPGSNTWTQRADFAGGDRYHAVGIGIGAFAYVGTGRDFAGQNYSDWWRYDPLTNTWTAMAPKPGPAVRGAVTFALNNKAYVATGSGTDDLYEYDPATNVWTAKSSMPGQGRTSSVGFSINGKGYVTTGEMNSAPTQDLWEYDPALDSWTQKANLPGLPRMEACGFAMSGWGYVGTGDDFSSGNNYQDFWAYNPVTDSWIQVADFNGAARRYMAAAVIGNRAYVGTGTSGINYSDWWEFGSVSGIDDGAAVSNIMQVIPNPIVNSASIRFSVPVHEAAMTVTDITGRELMQINAVSGDQVQFDRGTLASGVYLLRVTENGNIIAEEKIMLQ